MCALIRKSKISVHLSPQFLVNKFAVLDLVCITRLLLLTGSNFSDFAILFTFRVLILAILDFNHKTHRQQIALLIIYSKVTKGLSPLPLCIRVKCTVKSFMEMVKYLLSQPGAEELFLLSEAI